MCVLQVSANNVRGKLNGQQIQCVFDATVPANTARSTGVTLGVITGTYNGSKSVSYPMHWKMKILPHDPFTDIG